jgi:hypothetical protein
MKFTATLSRTGRKFPVEGQVRRQGDGGWQGWLSFATADARTIKPGRAKLTLPDGATWVIFVTLTQMSSDGSQGTSEFRVVKGLED